MKQLISRAIARVRAFACKTYPRYVVWAAFCIVLAFACFIVELLFDLAREGYNRFRYGISDFTEHDSVRAMLSRKVFNSKVLTE